MTGRNYGIVGIFGVGFGLRKVSGFTCQYYCAFKFAFERIEVGRLMHFDGNDFAGDIAGRGFTPAQRANPDAPLNRAGNFGGLDPSCPSVRYGGCLEMRLHAVVLKPL